MARGKKHGRSSRKVISPNIDLVALGSRTNAAIGRTSRYTSPTKSIHPSLRSFTPIPLPSLPQFEPSDFTSCEPVATSRPLGQDQHVSTPSSRCPRTKKYPTLDYENSPTNVRQSPARNDSKGQRNRKRNLTAPAKILASNSTRIPRFPIIPEETPAHVWDKGPYTKSYFKVSKIPSSPRQRNIPKNATNQAPKDKEPKPRSPLPDKVPQHPQLVKEIPSLPDNLDLIWCENRRMSTEAKRLEAEALEAAEREQEQKRIQQEKWVEEFTWQGDTSAYPAESLEQINFPNSEHRARAVCIGIPLNERNLFVSVFAVRLDNPSRVAFRVARNGSSPEEIFQGSPVNYQDIRLNGYFEGMSEHQAERWIRQLLAMVPGHNDTVMKWK